MGFRWVVVSLFVAVATVGWLADPAEADGGGCAAEDARQASARPGAAAVSPETGAATPGCVGGITSSGVVEIRDLAHEELRVLHYVMDGYLNEGQKAFTATDIRRRTGVELTADLKGRLLSVIYGEILVDAFPGGSPLAALEGCQACPSAGDLVLPSPEDVSRMKAELTQDGVPLLGFDAPDFALRDIRGRKVELGRLRGRPLALAFWSPGCAHSLREMGELQRLGELYGKTDLRVIAVVFTDEDRRALEKFARDEKLNIPVLISKDGKIRLAYQASLVPTVVLIDREGRMVKRLIGYKDLPALEAAVAALL